MELSRRRFLDAAALLALTSPLGGHAVRAARRGQANDAVAMAEAVCNGRTTALALVEQAIARLERANPQINAVALPNYDRARARAKAGVSGPLAGVPTLIKDNLPQKGLPNTIGTRLLRDQIADADAPYVQAIEKAGLISIGRSALPEFANKATTESVLTGATRNPWNLQHSVGGSSGGSSAAVAAGVVPVAHGNDFGGSIRHAAAPCGLIGLKPSRGRLIGEENNRDTTHFLVQGCVSRTVRDTAAWLAATETTEAGALHPPVGLVTGALTRKLRIGAHPERTHDGSKPDVDVLRVFARSTALLERLGHKVQPQPLAFDGAHVSAAFLDYFQGRAARGISAFAQRLGRPLTPDYIEPMTLGMIESGRTISDRRMAETGQIIAEMAERYTAQFDEIDIYMTPVFSTPPVKIGEMGPNMPWEQRRERLGNYAGYCWIDNAAGTPAISLPMGFSSTGLPIGIQFATRPGGDRLLLELAYQLENEMRWWELRPPLWVG